MLPIKLFDVRHLNDECQNGLKIKLFIFDISMSNDKMIRMSNVKLFDVRHSNYECQNDLNIKLFNVRHSNINIESQTV